jgi:hypothetical protein
LKPGRIDLNRWFRESFAANRTGSIAAAPEFGFISLKG